MSSQVKCTTRSRITNLTVDSAFKVVGVSTIDGFIHVFDLLTGNLVQSTFLNGEPRLLMVTPKWGYVLALCDDVISVLNVNGLLLKQERVKASIAQWSPFCSLADFDYAVFETTQGRLGFFDVFHPEKATVFYQIREPVASVLFDCAVGSFMLIAKSGHVTVLPHPPIE